MEKQYLPTGCKCIDNLLGGGFESQIITHVYGESGTGKSILALQCAYRAALNGFMTFYIDTERAFSATRLKQIAHYDFPKIGNLIFVYTPRTFSQQLKIIEKLENFLTEKVKIIIFDTITALYSTKISNSNTKSHFKINKKFNHQMAELLRLAEQFNLAILVNSQVGTQFSEGNIKKIVPINRKVLDYWCKVRIFLNFPEKRSLNNREAILMKHYNQETEKKCSFSISNEGCN